MDTDCTAHTICRGTSSDVDTAASTSARSTTVHSNGAGTAECRVPSGEDSIARRSAIRVATHKSNATRSVDTCSRHDIHLTGYIGIGSSTHDVDATAINYALTTGNLHSTTSGNTSSSNKRCLTACLHTGCACSDRNITTLLNTAANCNGDATNSPTGRGARRDRHRPRSSRTRSPACCQVEGATGAVGTGIGSAHSHGPAGGLLTDTTRDSDIATSAQHGVASFSAILRPRTCLGRAGLNYYSTR